MSLDEVLKATVESTVRAALEHALTERLSGDAITVLAPQDDRPLDATALKERGYSTAEAYALLNAHGLRLPGGRRARIARDVLERIERGELSPEISTAINNHRAAKKEGAPRRARLGS